MKGECPFKVGTSLGLPEERLEAAKKELKEFKEQNNVEEPNRKSFTSTNLNQRWVDACHSDSGLSASVFIFEFFYCDGCRRRSAPVCMVL